VLRDLGRRPARNYRLQLLPSLPDWELDENLHQHIHHLLGIAQYRDHSPDQAIATWLRGQAFEGRCNLDAYIDAAIYVSAHSRSRPSSGPATPTEEQALVYRLMATIDEADDLLSTGEPGQAVERLDHPDLWASKEVQSLARLVYALLEWDASTPHADFLRALAIVRFLDAVDPSRILGPVRLVFPGEWEQPRIEALAQRGKDWLAQKLARDG